MSVLGGDFGFGPQTAKGTMATTWYRHRAVRIGIGSNQDVRNLPLEVGGTFHPTGAYKGGVFGGGGAELSVRLENVFGWLLHAVAGQASVEADNPESGVNRHVFYPPAAATDMKWLSLRQKTPGENTDAGERIKDARAVSMRLVITPRVVTTAAMGFIGREPDFDTNVGSWSWANTYEGDESCVVANQGASISVGGSAQKASAVTVDLTNTYTTPADEAIIGSAYPDDFVLLSQVMSFTWVYKWVDPDLYRTILTSSPSGTTWDDSVYFDDIDIVVTSPNNISGRSNPYRIEIKAPKVAWQAAGPPQLVGGAQLRQQYVGVAQVPTAGEYYQIIMDNEATNYTWPT